jgi:hypothetical protein
MKRSYQNKIMTYKRLIRNLRLNSLKEGESNGKRLNDKKDNNNK